MGPEELHGALGTQRLPSGDAQDSGPAEVVARAGDSFFVRAAGFVLEEGEKGELRGRDAGTANAVGIEGGELFVLEEAGSGSSELAVEGVWLEGNGKDVADIEEVALEPTFSEHDSPPLAFNQGIYSTPRGRIPQRFSEGKRGLFGCASSRGKSR